MCGIIGTLSPGRLGFDPARSEKGLSAGLAAISHRGPDAAGVRLWPELGLGLGHCRLSILDLSERANQPMASPDGRVVVSYNGEIYNFRHLRLLLEKDGLSFSTTSDTEVLLKGYSHWGLEGVLERAAGMFAFALYDAGSRKLFLARDRAGKKPLYWAERGGSFYFCSEVRGLLKLWPAAAAVCREGLEAYLALKFAPEPLTLFEGIRKVRAGHYLEIGEGGVREVEYWSPFNKKINVNDLAGERLLDAVDEALTTAVHRRLVSDVPVCVFLSGGIDSSLIAVKLAQRDAGRVASYTIGYPDLPAYNEFDSARLVARRVPALDYRELRVSAAQVLEVLQGEGLELDEPISDWVWVPLHFLSRQARADSFKVALLGEGSDELFFGYDVMLRGLRQLERFENPVWRALARVGYELGRGLYRATHRGHRRYDLWRRAAMGLPVYWGSSIGFPRTQRRQVAGPALGPERADPAQDFIAGLYGRYARAARDPRDLVNLVSFIEFSAKMREVLLHRVDRVTMRHSLEARAPFLDHELVELAFATPGAAKIPQGGLKGLLKSVARRYLPREIVERPKMGFSFPFKEWLRGPLGPAVEADFASSRLFSDGWLKPELCRRLLKEHRGGRVDHAPRLWMIHGLCRWYEAWIV